MSNRFPAHHNERGHATRKAHLLLPITIALIVVCMFSLAAPAAKADSLSYVLVGSTDTISFSVPVGAPTADQTPFPGFALNALESWTLDGVAQTPLALSFWQPSAGGGFVLGDSFVFFGPQLFSGTDSAPTLLTGPFSITSCGACGNPLGNEAFNLTVTNIKAVPEPASLLLLGAGLLSVLGLAAYQPRRNDPTSAG